MAIDMEFRARVTQALSNTDKLIKKVVQLEERLKKVGRATQRTSRQQSALARGAIGQVRQMVTSYLGFQTVLRGVGKLFSDLEAKSATAVRVTLSLAQAEANFLINTTALRQNVKEFAKLEAAIERISAMGIERRVLLPIAGAAVSGAGGLPVEQVIEGMEIGTKFVSAGGDAVRQLVGATFDIKRAIREFSIPEAAGFLAQTAQFARIEEIGKTGRAIGGALTTLVEQGFSAKNAQALFITASLRAADTEGRRSSAGIIEFGTLLDKLFKGMPQESFEDRFKFMELHPRAQKKWAELTAGAFWNKLRKPFQTIFTKGSPTNVLFKRQITLIENSGATTEGRLNALRILIESFAKSSVQESAKLDRTLKAAIEEAVLKGQDFARLAIIRQNAPELMQQSAPLGMMSSLKQAINRLETTIAMTMTNVAPDVIGLGVLFRIHQIAKRNDMVTAGLVEAIRIQAGQVSQAELNTIQTDFARKNLVDFINRVVGPGVMGSRVRDEGQLMQNGPRVNGGGPGGSRQLFGGASDVEHFLERHRRLFWGGRPQFQQSEILRVAQELKRFIDTQISKEEIQAATATQQRELTIALQDLVIFLKRRPEMPANTNTHIENR